MAFKFRLVKEAKINVVELRKKSITFCRGAYMKVYALFTKACKFKTSFLGFSSSCFSWILNFLLKTIKLCEKLCLIYCRDL